MKKITVTTTIELVIHMDEDSNLDDVMSDMEYDFVDTTGTADVIDTKTLSYDVIDSR